MDKDGKGFITTAEAKAFRMEKFDELDTNKTGYLSKKELKAKHDGKKGGCKNKNCKKREERMDKAFAELDTNKDGKISRAEFETAGEKKIAKMDKNNDGKITEKEFYSARKKSGKKHCNCGK